MSDQPSPSAAPGSLEMVRAFVNTRNIETGVDRLEKLEGWRRWLADWKLSTEGSSEARRREALVLREQIRQLLLANHDGRVAAESIVRLNQAAEGLGLKLRFEADGRAMLIPSVSRGRAPLAQLLAVIFDAQAKGTWPRLKACRADQCQWAFYDGSRNRSGKWCDMAVCGNRLKARRHRRRQRADAR